MSHCPAGCAGVSALLLLLPDSLCGSVQTGTAQSELLYYASYGLVLQGEPRQGYGQEGPSQSLSDMVCTVLESRQHTFLGPVQTSA